MIEDRYLKNLLSTLTDGVIEAEKCYNETKDQAMLCYLCNIEGQRAIVEMLVNGWAVPRSNRKYWR